MAGKHSGAEQEAPATPPRPREELEAEWKEQLEEEAVLNASLEEAIKYYPIGNGKPSAAATDAGKKKSNVAKIMNHIKGCPQVTGIKTMQTRPRRDPPTVRIVGLTRAEPEPGSE